jgi:ligand-binding sensor domain-containing protein
MDKRFFFFLAILVSSLCSSAEEVLTHNLSYRRFTTLDGLSQMQTETVWQDSRGYIYIGTLSGFVRYDGLTLTPFLRGQRENIVGFQEVGGQVHAMGFVRQWSIRRSASSRDDDDISKMPIDPEGNFLLNNFNAADLPSGYVLLEDRQEKDRRLCRMTTTGLKSVMTSPLFDEMTPDRKMYLDTTGVYVPTPQGVYRLQEGHVAKIITDKSDVFAFTRTAKGLYALAADGLYLVESDGLTLLSRHHFDSPDYGLFVSQNRQGQLIAADSHTIWLYDSGLWRRLATGFNMIKGLFIDRWNRLWAATYQGAYCFFHCNFENHRLTDSNDIVRALAFDGRQMVMGTLNGKIISGGRLLAEDGENFFAPSATIIDGKVYMASGTDVAAIDGDTVCWLGLPDGRYQFVSRFGNRLIIGTRGSVLAYHTDTGQIDTLTTETVRPWCAADDGQGRLWIGCNPGLYRLTGIEDNKVSMEKVKSTPSTLVVTTMDGDGKGHVCFALGDSLFAINSGEIRPMAEALPVLRGHEIRSVHVSPQGYLVVATIDGLMVARIDDSCRARDIHWFDTQNGFTMIEPLMATMAETDDGSVWLAGLEETMSFHPDLLLDDNQESTVVEAPLPWWLQWWAWLCGILLLALAVWWMTRKFEQRRARRRMERLEEEKSKKELQLSAVRLKAIPHFHSNVMAGIEYFVSNHSTDEATHYLKLYSDFTNQTLADIDRPSRSVADEVDYVRAYLELEQLRYGERLQYAVNVSPEVDQNVMLPTMLLHTFCQNAVKHGIANKTGVGHVTVNVSRERREGTEGVLISVSDDGVGRSEAAHLGGPSTKQGLKILSQQIDLYNRTNKHHIQQHVTDLTDSEGHPAGTCFETWVPVEFRY